MRFLSCHSLGLLALLAPALASCDDITDGQLVDDPGPPVLVKLLIQDEQPRGGRNQATDLLDQRPSVACSEREPCPTGDRFSHPACNLTTLVCPDPLSPLQTPPTIGTPGTLGGDQIRLVFNKHLDPMIEVATTSPMTGQITGYALADPTIVGLYDAQGRELSSVKYWDPTGSPTLTSDIFVNPFGPALVVKPKAPFLPLTQYSIRLKPDQLRDDQGQAVAFDLNHTPIAVEYDFTTEGFHAAGGQLVDPTDTFKGAIDVKDALVIKTNARFDPATLKATVKKDGQVIETAAAPEYGTDPKRCFATAANPQQINIFRVTGEDRTDWDEGDYTVSVQVVSIDRPNALFSSDPFSMVPYADVPFSVKPNLDKDKLYLAEMLLLPWECAASPPTDMAASFIDLATFADLSPTGDMSSVPDGGADMSIAPDDGGADMSIAPDDGGADMSIVPDGGTD